MLYVVRFNKGLRLEAKDMYILYILYILLTIVVVFAFLLLFVIIFRKDTKHDMTLKIGNFLFSITKHD